MSNNTTCVEAQDLAASALAPMLILELILGIPGTVLALWILGCKAPWKPSTVYLLNLALADVLLLIGLPFRIDSVIRGSWIFEDVFCRINLFMLSVNQSASIAFMTLMAVDRFFRIVHPHHTICNLSIRSIVIISCVVWVAVVTLRLPLLVTQLLRSYENLSVSLCYNIYMWTESGLGMKVHNFLYVAEFILAFMLLLFCSVRIYYHIRDNTRLREHRRVKRTINLLLTAVIMFTLCFLPSYITGLVALLLKDVSSCSPYLVVGKLFSVSIILAYLNCALDPILYCLSNTGFRDTMKGVANSTGFTKFQLSVKETRSPRHT
ncbi:hypothetical protein MHYP_G00165650 [Metynnis hypsauchen]